MKLRERSFLTLFLIVLGVVAVAETARQVVRPSRHAAMPVPAADRLPVHRPLTAPMAADTSPTLARLAARGESPVRVFVFVDAEPLARLGKSADAATRRASAGAIRSTQDRLIPELEARGGTVLARLRQLSAGLVVSMPARRVPEIADLAEVRGVAEVIDYALHLSETIPFIGADVLQDLGIDGSEVVVGMIDSGIDYTHASLGGSGDPADYTAAAIGTDPGCITGFEPDCAAAMTPPGGLFPTAKVVGGFDFVGEQWIGAGGPPEVPDPNPIDRIGHGTHVADVLGGTQGVAPGVELYALKACSSQGVTCSGTALLQSLEFAMDPDGDPGTDDAVDVINMSLGGPYGQGEDPLVHMVDEAVGAGVTVVTSAGNFGDRPFGVSSPCVASRVICVGAEHKPSKLLYQVVVAGNEIPIAEEYYSTASFATIAGDLSWVGTGCSTVPPGSLSGRIAVAERGGCAYEVKARIAQDGGASAAIIADTRAESPYQLPDGDALGLHADPTIPVFTTYTAAGLFLEANDGQPATIDGNAGSPVGGFMAGFSSRGPSDQGLIKPDVAAPGAALTARSGTGTGLSTMGGTSMAAPHVAGSAALLLEAFPGIRPEEVHMLLSQTSRDGLLAGLPGAAEPAPVTWTGAGSVDVAAAANADIFSWYELPATEGSLADRQPDLPWPYVAAPSDYSDQATIWFFNPTADPRDVSVSSRFTNPAQAGQGVSVEFLQSDFTVAPFAFEPQDTELVVAMPTHTPPPTPQPGPTPTPQPDRTPMAPADWAEVDRGANGYNGRSWAQVEFDGRFDIVVDGTDTYTMPFNVVVKRAADMSGVVDTTAAPQVTGSLVLSNGSGANNGVYETFVNVDNSENRYGHVVGDCVASGRPPGCDATPVDLDGVGVAMPTTGVPEPMFELAVTTHETPYRGSGAVAQFDARFDTNLDGVYDYAMFNTLLADGRSGVFTFDLTGGMLDFAGFLDSDFNSAAYVLRAPAASLGLAPGIEFDMVVLAWDDWLDSGTLYDCSPFPPAGQACGFEDHRMTYGEERFRIDAGMRYGVVGVDGDMVVPFESTAQAAAASPSHIGLFALYRNAPVGAEAQSFVLIEPGVDDDGDGRGNAKDCDPADPGAFAVPGEVPPPSVVWPLRAKMTWQPVNVDSGSGTQYRVFLESGGFGPVGAAPDGTFSPLQSAPSFDAVPDPLPGELVRALVRAENACGEGSWGANSEGAEREP